MTFFFFFVGKFVFDFFFAYLNTDDIYNLNVTQPNQTPFGINSLTSLSAQIWNSLTANLKSSDNLQQFKK